MIPGANFSEDCIVIPLRFLLAANASVELQNGLTFPSSGVTDEDTYFEILDEADVPTYNLFAVGTGDGSPYVKEAYLNLTSKTIGTNLLQTCAGLVRAKITAMASSSIRNLLLNCTTLRIADISGLDTRNAENINYLFSGCSELQEIMFGDNDFSSITTLTGCFNGCLKLMTISGNIYGLGAASLSANMVLNLSSCPLSKESAKVFINGLNSPETADGFTRTIIFSDSTYALLDADDKALITAAGWIDGNINP